MPVPMVVDHEYVGRIEAVGGNGLDFKPRDLVAGEDDIVCGHCRNCLADWRHLCMQTRGVWVNRLGAFAEHVVIPMSNVWLCDTSTSMEVPWCFDPAGQCGAHVTVVRRSGRRRAGLGGGPIGIMAAVIAWHAADCYVVIIDIRPDRLDLARKVHPTMAMNVNEMDLGHMVSQLGMKEGVDVRVEMWGSPEALNDMLRVMCHGGKVAMTGIQPPGTGIDWNPVVFNGLTLKGICGWEMYQAWYKMTMLIQTGLDIVPIIAHQPDCEQFETGFDLMRRGKAGKVVLDWN